jgi:hypothetical protein
MKRVVIIGADFTPSSLPPALRIRFFARHLPAFGWDPIVLTTRPDFYECAVDGENEQLLPDNIQVIRTAAIPAHWGRKVGIGDIGMRSFWHHWRVLSALCKQHRPDLIFVPVPPYVPMVLGRMAHLRFGVPYVIDYIDPWVTEYYWKLPRAERPPKWPMAYALARMLEPFALRRAGAIVGVSRGTTDSVLSRYDWLGGLDVAEIPYGGEDSDFEYLQAHPRVHNVFDMHDGFLHVSYVGACIPPMYPAVRALFEAARQGLERSPDLFRRLRLHFVGTSYAHKEGRSPIAGMAREMGLEAHVQELPGRIPYLDALQVLLDSHALVVLGSEEPHYTASKIFPYILSRKPLLAIFHEDSSVVSILRGTRAGELVTFNAAEPPANNVVRISELLERLLSLPSAYKPPTVWEAFSPYTTFAMTAKLAQVFDSVMHKKRKSRPASLAEVPQE